MINRGWGGKGVSNFKRGEDHIKLGIFLPVQLIVNVTCLPSPRQKRRLTLWQTQSQGEEGLARVLHVLVTKEHSAGAGAAQVSLFWSPREPSARFPSFSTNCFVGNA